MSVQWKGTELYVWTDVRHFVVRILRRYGGPTFKREELSRRYGGPFIM